MKKKDDKDVFSTSEWIPIVVNTNGGGEGVLVPLKRLLG